MLNRKAVLCVVSSWIVAVVAVAQTSQPASDLEQVRSAAVAFARALNDPDIKSTRSLFAGEADRWAIVEGFHTLIQAGVRYNRAAEKAFPEKKPRGFKSFMNPEKLITQLEKLPPARVIVDGDTAQIADYGFGLNKIQGHWKITSYYAKDDAELNASKGRLATMTQLLTDGAADLEAGKFKTPEEMEQAMRQRESQARPSPSPATRPAR